MMYCFSEGSDTLECCKENGVSEHCQHFCTGHLNDFKVYSNMHISRQTFRLLQCMTSEQYSANYIDCIPERHKIQYCYINGVAREKVTYDKKWRSCDKP